MKIIPDKYALMRKCDGYWEQLHSGTEEECREYATEQTKYWYDGETVMLCKVTTEHTPIHSWVGHVTYTEQEF